MPKTQGITYVIAYDDGRESLELTCDTAKERDVAYAALTARRMTGDPIRITGYLELHPVN